ncbi:MAG: alpha-1,2-fucosyltransferase [Prevotella sp.]|nr:alpha-1,2-fucosyltransferase [Prevotella sp.]
MINLIVKDGLGNQMFQYAFARMLQQMHLDRGEQEQILIINKYIDTHTDHGNEARQLSLNHLSLHPMTSIMAVEAQDKALSRFKVMALLSSGIRECVRWRILKQYNSTDALMYRRGTWGVYYPYGPYPFHPITLSKRKEKYIFGFFQNFNYVHPLAQVLKEELLVKTPASAANQKYIEEIAQCNAVCLHIRRGDYLNPRWKNLQICDFNYYNQAINYILNKTENPVFFVFSNTHKDLEWIKENYKFYDTSNRQRAIKLRFVDMENPDYEELRLMYSCKHFIISNSTFSWWAAWLGKYTEKIVIAPERWNLEYDNDTNIYDPSWHKIQR